VPRLTCEKFLYSVKGGLRPPAALPGATLRARRRAAHTYTELVTIASDNAPTRHASSVHPSQLTDVTEEDPGQPLTSARSAAR
jgi:alkylhydroperoxidase family enzyme